MSSVFERLTPTAQMGSHLWDDGKPGWLRSFVTRALSVMWGDYARPSLEKETEVVSRLSGRRVSSDSRGLPQARMWKCRLWDVPDPRT